MKIIKKGDGNQAECGSCRSILEFDPSDVSSKSAGKGDDGDDIFSHSIRCPNCGATVLLGNMTATMRGRIATAQRGRDLSDFDL